MKLVFANKYPIGGGAVSFEFTPADPIVWIAGQSIRLEVPTRMGVAERRFTISSAPYEGHITVTTRIGDSDFKQSLDSLTPGQTISAYAIEGTFTWPDTPLDIVLVAAGVGITPYRAMLKQREHDNKPLNATLIYGASSQDMPFADEMTRLQASHPEFTAVLLAGTRLTADVLHLHANMAQSMVYVSGPTKMVDDVTEQLLAHGVQPGNIKRDWFTGRFEGISF